MQKIFIGIIIVLLLISAMLGYIVYNDRAGKSRIIAINQRLETQLRDQNETIRKLENSERSDRITIEQLKTENRILREIYNLLREFQQRTNDIITGIETAEGIDSERLKRLEQIITNLPKK